VTQVEQLEHLKKIFRDRFKSDAEIIVRAPGRVELIGNHTDYNDGFVLPMAIDRECLILARRRMDRTIRIYSELFDETCEFELSPDLQPGEPFWANFPKGVASLLLKAGKQLGGLDMTLACDIPAGGGLSSSAAIEIGYGRAFLAASGETIAPVDLALVGQQAEHTFAGAPCGIMDQFICALGKADHALLLDCRSREYELVPVPFQHASLLIADSKVKHNLGQSGYPLRRQQCFEVVDILKNDLPQITHLRDVDMAALDAYKDKLDAVHYARARHVITENDRVMKMAEGFRSGDLALAGRMMNESHASSRDDYDVSCEELDFLVETAQSCKGVYGARMSGGGFGGCIVALVENDVAKEIESRLNDAYNKKYDKTPGIFFTGAAEGAEVIKA
jgi:galactokinase